MLFSRTPNVGSRIASVSLFLMQKCHPRFFARDSTGNLFSALYVSNRYKDKVYPALRPNLDFDFVVENWEAIKTSVSMRGMNSEEFAMSARDLKGSISQLKDLESRIEESVSLLQRKYEGKELGDIPLIKSELVKFRENHWFYENRIIPSLLKRPNMLHPETVTDRKVISKCDSFGRLYEDHRDFGLKKKWLFFHNCGPGAYYLVDKLAHLEFAIIDYFRNLLQTVGFQSMSASHIAQTALLEATGKTLSEKPTFIQLKGKKDGLVQEYLVGSSALEALAAYFTRMIIPKPMLPIQLFNVGRHYSGKNDASVGLYDPVQSTHIACFMVCEGKDVANIFKNMTDLLKTVYNELNVPHQVVVVSAKELDLTETIRIQVEVWSPFLKRYVPCASVSQHSDFLSKRLMMQKSENKAITGFVHTISATAVSVPVLIASLIENRPEENDFCIPTALQPFAL